MSRHFLSALSCALLVFSPCLVLPAENEPRLPDYDIVAGVDSVCSQDLAALHTDDIIKLARICNEQPGCQGFNSRGELKRDTTIPCRDNSDEIVLYVKRPLSEDAAAAQAPITPQPAKASMGSGTATLASPFSFKPTSSDTNVTTFLNNAWARYTPLIMTHTVKEGGNGDLTDLEVTVSNTSMELSLGTDESYELSIPASGSATLSSQTVYGALRGLETFSQLIGFSPRSQQYTISHVPWNIQDMPRFSHRGVLLDTSRHYHGIPSLKRFVDSLSYAKFNVFHWHIVDSQAFPLQLHTLPNLVKGAYTPAEIYTPEDVASIVEYAKARGVRVIPEFDTPGHAGSWCVGYPEICPSPNCTQPLNPATNATFDLIKTLITEAKTLWTDDYLHLGGDEVHAKCWNKTPSVAEWLKTKNFSTDDAYKYFVQITHSLARSLGRKSIHWEEVFNHFGSGLDKDTIFQVWLSHATASKIVAAGYQCILSNSGVWYLPHLAVSWEKMYSNDPLMNITDPSQQKLMLGGEACMWGETVDDSDLFNTVWPRAAAVAERLWSPASVQDTDLFKPRLENFKCLLTRRGIGAAATNNKEARSAPPGPGSCLNQ